MKNCKGTINEFKSWRSECYHLVSANPGIALYTITKNVRFCYMITYETPAQTQTKIATSSKKMNERQL